MKAQEDVSLNSIPVHLSYTCFLSLMLTLHKDLQYIGPLTSGLIHEFTLIAIPYIQDEYKDQE